MASTGGFPGSTPFTLALDYGAANEELVDVTMVAGLSLTVTRAVDGTSGTGHNAGAIVRHVSSGRDFSDSRTHENSTQNVHGVSGVGNNVVGTTSTQTLSNKTLDRATGTLNRVDIFNTGVWTTTVIGDSTNPTQQRFTILDNEINLTQMATFDDIGGLKSIKKAGEADGLYRFRVTDSDTTTDRFEVLSGGTLSVYPNASSTRSAIAVRTTESNTEGAFLVSDPDGTNQRFAVQKNGAVITASDLTVTGNATVGGSMTTNGIGQTLFARKTADTSRASTTTATDDPHLTVSISANSTYILEAYLEFSADSSADILVDWGVPASSAGSWTGFGNGLGEVAPATNGYAIRTDSNTISQQRNFGGIGAGNHTTVFIRGIIRTAGTGGAYTMQWAQGASLATATVLYTDSWMRVTRVA